VVATIRFRLEDTMAALQFFDRSQEYSILERGLPHWVQSGVVCFITWRTNDSIPADALERWQGEKRRWLREHGINPRAADWRQRVRELPSESQQQFYDTFSDRWHGELDSGRGACVLKNATLSLTVCCGQMEIDMNSPTLL